MARVADTERSELSTADSRSAASSSSAICSTLHASRPQATVADK
ncbi:hypothetical protein SCE1572_40245 [Sorangium cellulosum So0157-2]|uniref:Uncharacterized protein n=1 Tax=Sorangium cellulosum So0157-2 TaxID=1254432 RepID=S4Y6Y1_SORCE|nr:hypothetical protein SCE1572_40245 [Sorangium cellulosum So0157-2]